MQLSTRKNITSMTGVYVMLLTLSFTTQKLLIGMRVGRINTEE